MRKGITSKLLPSTPLRVAPVSVFNTDEEIEDEAFYRHDFERQQAEKARQAALRAARVAKLFGTLSDVA